MKLLQQFFCMMKSLVEINRKHWKYPLYLLGPHPSYFRGDHEVMYHARFRSVWRASQLDIEKCSNPQLVIPTSLVRLNLRVCYDSSSKFSW